MANRIHPTAIIGAGVELGDNNVIGPYTVIVGPTRIGDANWIGPHVSIGTPAEYMGGAHPAGWDDEVEGVGVLVGNGNKIREFVTINQGTHDVTIVGDDCYLMGRCHIGHDSQLRNSVVLAGGAILGGHTQIWSWANVGLGTVIHQRCVIAPGVMVGMGSAIRKDPPPFTIVVGNPARVTSVNSVGLTRRGCDEAMVENVSLYIAGKADLPSGLPAELADEINAWLKTQSSEKESR